MSMNLQRREVYEQQILRCLLGKMYIKDIAATVGLNETTVRKYIRAEGFRSMLREKYPEVYSRVDAELQEQADTISVILEERSLQALKRLERLIESDNEHIALKASQDALDRFQETSKVQKIEAEHQVKIDPIFLAHAIKVAREVDEFEAKKPEPSTPALPAPKKETIQ